MAEEISRSAGTGLEGSCGPGGSDWFRSHTPVAGVERLEARFSGFAYGRHRHDTYAIGVTVTGAQAFDYRGAARLSGPGEVFVLHPDEPHDGRAGSDAGFGYRQVYVAPARIAEAARQLTGSSTLPFVREPVSRNARLAAALQAAFRFEPAPLASDDLVLELAAGLLAGDPDRRPAKGGGRLDLRAVGRARLFLEAETGRVVRSAELEAVSGLSRFELARQFRAVCGTSPYRFSLLRRLDAARGRIGVEASLAEVALDSGFADQAHFTRLFKSAYGLTPARYARLAAREAS